MTNFKLALIQLLIGKDKAANVRRAVAKITEAAKNGANLVVLPEFFNSPYGNEYFKEYAEPVPGLTTAKLSEAAKELKIDLIGGTLPEEHGGKLFNTCPIFNKSGSMIAKYRKMHLFDIDVPGKITFKESEMLSAGNQPVIFENDLCKTGIGVCYDVRFSELAHLYALNGCNLLVYPAAFNMTTGPPHWELMARSRAVQTQCYVALCSPARDPNASYVAWGHSLVVDPWGQVITSTNEKETILYADIDLVKLEEIRTMIPIWKQRRTDIYSTECLVNPLNVF